ncbi:hypothetical protein Misp05_33940 [Micromonospora sp. NBRC 107095]|nr:hypothetical protein Misp05_33940 [Micromonospora sp. NBRC 107095]
MSGQYVDQRDLKHHVGQPPTVVVAGGVAGSVPGRDGGVRGAGGGADRAPTGRLARVVRACDDLLGAGWSLADRILAPDPH